MLRHTVAGRLVRGVGGLRKGALSAVVAALRSGDPERAAASANDLLEPGTTAVLSAIDRLLAEEDDQ